MPATASAFTSKPRKLYALNQCAFYKLKNKRKFANLFHLPLKSIDALLAKPDNYRIFHIGKEGSHKLRLVEWPKPHLERLHRRVLVLLQRIEYPPYLHSGVKGRSYITNANQHIGPFEVVKLDIKAFYPSTKSLYVYNYFKDEMLCSSDIAGLVTKLLTHDGHIPTGSCVSQQIAYLVHKNMFDKIYALAMHNEITMTCYVDDLAFSGERVPGKFIAEVKEIIRKAGLKYHKEMRYDRSQPKLITGVIVTESTALVRNKLLKKIYEGLLSVEEILKMGGELENLDRLIGQINAANQINNKFSGVKRRVEGYKKI